MKKLHEEIEEHASIKTLKRYYLDGDEVFIELYNVNGDEEKLISTMKIPWENAPEKIKAIVVNIL